MFQLLIGTAVTPRYLDVLHICIHMHMHMHMHMERWLASKRPASTNADVG
jgi:hypothetical protein